MTFFAQPSFARSSLIWLSLSMLVAFQLLAAGWVLCMVPGGHVQPESAGAPCPDAGTECHDLPLFSVTPFAKSDGNALSPVPAPALAVLPIAVGSQDAPRLALAGPGRNSAPPPPARLAPVLLI